MSLPECEEMKPLGTFNKGNHFINLTNQVHYHIGIDGSHYFDAGTGRIPMQFILPNADKKGIYAINNGVIAFVDEVGEMWIGYATDETKKMLDDANYLERGLNVPASYDAYDQVWMALQFKQAGIPMPIDQFAGEEVEMVRDRVQYLLLGQPPKNPIVEPMEIE